MKARNNLPNTSLPRIYFIDRRIASGSYPNTASLAKEYETSMSSISRDIDFMRTMLNAPIEYDARRRGYYYSEKTYRIPAGCTTAEDLLALGMAKTLLSLYRNTPLYAVLTFDYRGGWDREYKPRRTRPYQLLFDNGVWYLYAWAEERKDIRVFSVARIKNAALTADTFNLPADYDYRVRSDGSYFGVFSGTKKYTFRAAFYAESEMWVSEGRWAADQSIRQTKDGLIISFSSTQYGKVLEWVLSRGGSARPPAPEVLAADWKRHVRAMTKMARAKK
jgi:hypothetical protein